MSRYLVLGADGMLGTAFMLALAARGADVQGAQPPELDFADCESIRRVVRDADVVINCAAYTDVDGAETNEELATAINGHGVGDLAARCDELGAKLVHFSTDYVFDGDERAEPYATDHGVAPLNAYGRGKLVGEERVLAADGPHLIVRTSWLYAPWGKNFVRTIAGLAAQRPELRVVDDQRGRPTSAEHLAATTLALLDAEASPGVYHVTDGEQCTWFDFATEIARHAGPECAVAPCTSAEYPRPAKRPAYSVLDLSKTEALVGPMTPWKQNLRAVLAQLDV